MAEVIEPDICVIGAGSAGLSLAAGAAALGVSVVLVEKGRMGGDCLNFGCVPSKALIAAARRADAPRRAAAFGVTAQRPAIDFGKVHDHVHAVVNAVAPNDSKERFSGLGVRVIEGAAQFQNPSTVTVGADFAIKARRFVIAAGSSPALPAIPGLENTAHLTNETIFDLTQCPDHLIVLGAGPIGLELAQAYRRLGAKVTVLEAARPLAREDGECAGIVLEQLAREGIAIRSGIEVVRVEPAESNVRLILKGINEEEAVEGSHLLVATGRRANVEGLGLEAAGIKYGADGISVDRTLLTSNKKVYAIGDSTGAPHQTHRANYHAGLVIRHALFRLPMKVREETVPRVLYTDPELAHVGWTETDVRKQGLKFRLLRASFHDNDRAQALRETRGHIKVVTSKYGRILGATIVGPQAGELITTWSLALQQGLNVRAFADVVMPYPTLSETGKRAALSFFTPSLTSPWVRRIIDLVRRFG